MSAIAKKVARQFLARKRRHYRFTDRKLRQLNDSDSREESMKMDGGYSLYSIEIVPIRDIKVPKV